MSPLRWAATIVGFPLGGLAAIQIASTTAGPISAALGGLVAGAVLGLAQWLALRPRVTAWWIAATAAGLAVGASVATLVTSGAADPASLALFGAIAGAVVGLGQGLLLGMRRAVVWIATVTASWTLAWLITAAVIVDEQRGYVLFGLSGAALATILTGVVLRIMLGARVRATRTAEQVTA